MYHQNGGQNGHDIGTGSPAEILREGELTYELLLLYFENFSDIHFMFDQDVFLRQFALGEIPKVILYSMMALGIKYVGTHDFSKKDINADLKDIPISLRLNKFQGRTVENRCFEKLGNS